MSLMTICKTILILSDLTSLCLAKMSCILMFIVDRKVILQDEGSTLSVLKCEIRVSFFRNFKAWITVHTLWYDYKKVNYKFVGIQREIIIRGVENTFWLTLIMNKPWRIEM